MRAPGGRPICGGRGSRGQWHAQRLLGGDRRCRACSGSVPVTGVRTIWSRRPARAPSRSRRSSPRPRATRCTHEHDLGRMLFFDPRLSASRRVRAATPATTWPPAATTTSRRPSATAGSKAAANAPTVLNAVFNIAQFWDGRAEDLEAQAKGPVQPRRDGSTPEQVRGDAQEHPGLRRRVPTAFPARRSRSRSTTGARRSRRSRPP